MLTFFEEQFAQHPDLEKAGTEFQESIKEILSSSSTLQISQGLTQQEVRGVIDQANQALKKSALELKSPIPTGLSQPKVEVVAYCKGKVVELPEEEYQKTYENSYGCQRNTKNNKRRRSISNKH